MRSGIPSLPTKGVRPMLPESNSTGEPFAKPWRTLRSQLRNSSAFFAPWSSVSRCLRKIGNSSITRRTGLSWAAHSWKRRSPCRRQVPASNPARNFNSKSWALIASMFSMKRLIALATRDERARTGCVALAMAAIKSSGELAPSTSANRNTHPWVSRRRPSSWAMLVLPMRRCPVSRMWLPSRTRLSRTFSSASRSKKSSPLTQRPVADFMDKLHANGMPNRKAQQNRCQRRC